MSPRNRIRAAAKRLFAGRRVAGESAPALAPAAPVEMSGSEVIFALLGAVDDQELGHLEDIMAEAGVMWRCNSDRVKRVFGCGAMNEMHVTRCVDCDEPRPVTDAVTG